MNGNVTVFLRAMHSAMVLEGSQTIRAEQVNTISQGLGLSLDSIPALMDALKREGLVDLQWGGTVSLTARGRDIAKGKTEGGQGGIQVGDIGAGAQVAIGSQGAVVGHEAMGAGAQRFEYRGNTGLGVADLVALVHELRQLAPQLESEAQPVAQELETTLKATLEEAKQPTPNKASVEQHLERAIGIMERLGKLSAAAFKLAPLLDGIRRVFM